MARSKTIWVIFNTFQRCESLVGCFTVKHEAQSFCDRELSHLVGGDGYTFRIRRYPDGPFSVKSAADFTEFTFEEFTE